MLPRRVLCGTLIGNVLTAIVQAVADCASGVTVFRSVQPAERNRPGMHFSTPPGTPFSP
jgi:hypothetical protein